MSYTISDTDYISSGNQLFDPNRLLSYTITDTDYISSGNALYDPVLNSVGGLLADYIGSTHALYDPTVINYAQYISDTDFIGSGNALYTPIVYEGVLWSAGHFRFENDDGTTLDNSTFIAGEDVNTTIDVDTNFRLRINWGSRTTNGPGTQFRCEVEFRVNSGDWTEVAAGEAVAPALSRTD